MPGLIGAPQDSPVAILSATALAIAAKMNGAPADIIFITVIVTIILASVVSDWFFLAIGGSKLSRLVVTASSIRQLLYIVCQSMLPQLETVLYAGSGT